MYDSIRDYAIIGDGHTAALVSRGGSIDWCCWPRFDSGAVFCRILDEDKGGWFRVAPAGACSSSRRYVDGTNVLETTFRAEGGSFRVTDLMPIEQRSGEQRGRELVASNRILRLVEGVQGSVRLRVDFRPTIDYGRAHTGISVADGGAVAGAGTTFLTLASPVRLSIDPSGTASGEIDVTAGDRFWIALAYGDHARKAEAAAANADRDLKTTLDYWRDWIGRCSYDGPFAPLVRRSALVLKLLIYSPSGALVAAPTTSLPERIGGARNWDYRYTWLRDSSLILHALETLGYYDEALNFFGWLEKLDLRNRGRFQIMYTIEGHSDLPEYSLDHLQGYRGSAPVRVGNGASEHVQLDIYGEVLDAAHLCFEKLRKKMTPELWSMLSHLAGRAAADWRRPDRSIWEFRAAEKQFTYSKLLCWVALDRALRLAEALRLEGPLDQWRATRDEIRQAVLTQGYNQDLRSFVQSFGSSDVDASMLAIQRVGFLPPNDPRVISTLEQIRRHLGRGGGLLHRYVTNDGISGGEGTFTLCTLWMIMNLAGQGRTAEAHDLFEKVAGYASDLGLLSEEIEPATGALLGNYPQGFTHLGLIRAAASIGESERRRAA